MVATHVALSNVWISSSVLPLVSGTSFATNSTVTRLAAENKKNVPAGFQSMRKLNEYEIAKEPNQLARVTNPPAIAFMSIENISDMITQGTGPIPTEYAA